jgi:hypothetical protein
MRRFSFLGWRGPELLDSNQHGEHTLQLSVEMHLVAGQTL